MAYSKTFLLVGLLFAVVLIMSSEVSARELAETAQTQGSVEDGYYGHGHYGYGKGYGHGHYGYGKGYGHGHYGYGKGYGHGKGKGHGGYGHGKPGHGGAADVEADTEGDQN